MHMLLGDSLRDKALVVNAITIPSILAGIRKKIPLALNILGSGQNLPRTVFVHRLVVEKH
jgi:hypothetical protein